MQGTTVLVLLLTFVSMSIVASFKILHDDTSETNPHTSSLSSFVSDDKTDRASECLSKQRLEKMLHRNRRASISRPYFFHWRRARESARPASKNFLAFSPRLGRKALDDEISDPRVDEEDNDSNKERLSKPTQASVDSDTFLIKLIGHLQEKKLNIIYEDATKICSSQVIGDELITEILEKMGVNHPHPPLVDGNNLIFSSEQHFALKNK